MMKPICLILFLAIIFCGCKDDINNASKRNENWVWWVDAKTGKPQWIPHKSSGLQVKNGRFTLFYFNGNIYQKGKLIDGESVDTLLYYDIKGKLSYYGFPKKDTIVYYYLKDGRVRCYYPSGKIGAEGIIKSHVVGDQWKTYYENGETKALQNYRNGVGWFTNYYKNGNVKDSSYDDGIKMLCVKEFYENGHIRKAMEIKNGNFNGANKEYYENGQLKSNGTSLNGRNNGDGTVWYANGKLHGKVHYVNGKQDGHQTIFYENGKIQTEANMSAGVPNGDIKIFSETGKLIGVRTYQNGVLTSQKILDSAAVKAFK